jgi:hypothetical protein
MTTDTSHAAAGRTAKIAATLTTQELGYPTLGLDMMYCRECEYLNDYATASCLSPYRDRSSPGPPSPQQQKFESLYLGLMADPRNGINRLDRNRPENVTRASFGAVAALFVTHA